MQSTTISNYQPTFGRLYTGNNAKRQLCSSDNAKNMANKFISLKKILYKQHYSKAKHIDAIIDYNNKDGFFLWISNKHGVLPSAEKSPFFKNIINTEKCINELTEWVNYWNSLCGHLH